MAQYICEFGTIVEPAASGHFVLESGTMIFSAAAATGGDVIFWNRTNAIESGEIAQTSAQLNGVIIV